MIYIETKRQSLMKAISWRFFAAWVAVSTVFSVYEPMAS